MKKQFFRVKQLADQTFSRADKTEVLSDDLQEADRRVEYIRTACQNTSKKLAGCVSGQGQERDKRLKKVPEHMLGAVMQECVPGVSDEDFLLGKILHICGRVEQELAIDEVDYELDVEQKVLAILQMVSDKDVPNIMKHKRNLTKLTLDMDSAKTRYHTALKHSANTGTARVESIKAEMEDAESKVEQCRDQLASEMFQLVSRESELAHTIVQYAKLQQEYHRAALARLELVIPQLERDIVESPHKPVYGVTLEAHLQVTDRKIALPIELFVWALLVLGMEEEGLFRVAGGASKLRRMKLSMDAQCLTPQAIVDYRDPHVVAGALKSYLRELPEPLMTYSLYDDWMTAARVQASSEARLQALWQVVQKLPVANYNNLRYLIRFLHVLSQNHEVNKMTPQNIAIVIAPNLIWSKNADTTTMGMNMNAANTYSLIVDNLVSFAEWFFPGGVLAGIPSKRNLSTDLDFYENYARESALLVNGMSASAGPVLGWEGSSPPPAAAGHTRSSSGEGQLISLAEAPGMKRAQSSSSLSDHSSPPQGSPKPATRRKNKPAPVPPASNSAGEPKAADKPEKPPRPSVAPCVSTLPRPSKQPLPSSQAEGPRPSGAARRSLDLDHALVPEQPAKADAGAVASEGAASNGCKSEEEPAAHSKSTVCSAGKTGAAVDSAAARAVSASAGVWAAGAASERRPQQRPVAAPRSIVNVNFSGSSGAVGACGEAAGPQAPPRPSLEAECGVGGGGAGGEQSRRSVGPAGPEAGSGDRLSKPVVPERPAALLRPHASSFRLSRHSSDSDSAPGDKTGSESERPMLERAHVYSVDKQQVSIVEVRGERDRARPGLRRSPSLGGGPWPRPSSASLPGKPQEEKPERPSKLEVFVHSEGKEQRSPGHWRTLSEGNLIDVDIDKPAGEKLKAICDQPPASPRAPCKPPRPIPPPPPPPLKPRSDSIIESTDL